MRGLLTGLALVVLAASVIVLLTVRPAASEPERPVQIVPPGPMPHDHHRGEKITDAVCVLRPTEGHRAAGVVRLRQTPAGVELRATFRNLEPGGIHAFHIHEFGDITARDATSAGSHYNPEGHDHGLPEAGGSRHAGDLGNVIADDRGVAVLHETFDNFSIAGDHNPVLGRAMVLHEHEDDGSQPVGNAGARIAVGVIGVAEPIAPEPAESPAAEPAENGSAARTPPPAPSR